MRQALILIVLALIIIPIVVIFQYNNSKPVLLPKKSTLAINGHEFEIEIARTLDQKEKGLSNKPSLPQNKGMLFIFDKPDIYDFWMKEMKFPLDIIWISKNKIITIADNLQPTMETDLNKIPRFKSVLPADMVLEVNAGTVKKYSFKLGDNVSISL